MAGDLLPMREGTFLHEHHRIGLGKDALASRPTCGMGNLGEPQRPETLKSESGPGRSRTLFPYQVVTAGTRSRDSVVEESEGSPTALAARSRACAWRRARRPRFGDPSSEPRL